MKLGIIKVIALGAIILLAILLLWQMNKKNQKFVTIDNLKVKVEIVEKPEAQAKGLAGRDKLGKNAGLLFLYHDYQIRSFWMKGMKFKIDIIWIKDKEIVGIEKNVPLYEETNTKHYLSPIPVNYVLEVNAGFCDQNNIKVGDRVKFDLDIKTQEQQI